MEELEEAELHRIYNRVASCVNGRLRANVGTLRHFSWEQAPRSWIEIRRETYLVFPQNRGVLSAIALNVPSTVSHFAESSLSQHSIQVVRLSISEDYNTSSQCQSLHRFHSLYNLRLPSSGTEHARVLTSLLASGGMESKQHERFENSGPPAERTNPSAQPWPAGIRPLSDIRELTEPSLVEITNKKSAASVHRQPSLTRHSSLKRGPSLKRTGSVRIIEPSGSSDSSFQDDCMTSDSTNDTPQSFRDASSIYSIPFSSVPPRASSQTREPARLARNATSRSSPTPLQRNTSRVIPNRGKSRSPVKQAASRLDAVASDTSRRIPSRTFVRNPYPRDILEFPSHRHPRIGIDLQIGAPLFVGGSSVEGYVRIVVDDAEKMRNKSSLTIGRIAVDLVGTEETSSNRRSIFLSLGTELIDSTHPPPRNMIESKNFPDADCFWTLIPSFSSLPFLISLPLDTGPPPFQSKHARIRFILCATMLVKDAGKQYLVRCSQDVSVLPTYDPEKALRSLSSPLTASDEHAFLHSGLVETAKMTAGLHRQVWVSGSSIFVDVHIANGSRKTIKKLDLCLERDILCYRHAAAATLEQSASQARIFESNDRSILSKSSLKQGANGWTGIEAYGSVTRTCDLEIPRGHATVKCGKFFEVRYFLNICLGGTRTKILSVQLPIILIHMNSLDILPNSVAQVAAAIEEKRSHHHRTHTRQASNVTVKVYTTSPSKEVGTHRRPSRLQGRAFAAPRQQSLERMRAEAADMKQIAVALESSPRKHNLSRQPTSQRPQRSRSVVREGSKNNTKIISRPAREIHKQPSNLSLGGISVGSYTIFNDNSSSPSNQGMEYITPPSRRKGRVFWSPNRANKTTDPDAQKQPLQPLRSKDSIRSSKSTATVKSRWRDHFGNREKDTVAPVTARQQQELGSHALGLASHNFVAQPEGPVRSSLDRVTRDDGVEWPDNSRFEFKAIKGKVSSKGLKGWLGGRMGAKFGRSGA